MQRSGSVTYTQVTKIALALPGVVEAPSYGAPALKVGKKLTARLREPGVLVLTPVHDDERKFLMETQPDVYYLTDHYRGSTAILVRLTTVDRTELRDLIEQCWRRVAPPKVVAEYDAREERSDSRSANKGATTQVRRS